MKCQMKKDFKNSEDQGGKWLLTFNDLVTLLLTFFVLTLSLSTLDVAKVKKASYSLSTAFGMLESGGKGGIRVFTPFVFPIGNQVRMFEEKKSELTDHINRIGEMDANVIEEGVSVTMGEKLLFKSGMAEIEEVNHRNLKPLCSILQKTDCRIKVEGHTDDVPVNNDRFSSNWELSVARAVNVVKYFISEGGILPERLSAAGYADSRPLLPNVSDHNRELNRRVEVILTLKKTVS